MTYDIWMAINKPQGELGDKKFGMGKTTDGSGWTWYTATWDNYSEGNSWIKFTDDTTAQFTSTGTWYYAGMINWSYSDHYCVTDWADNPSLSAVSYFTVNALSDPTDGASSAHATYPATAITLTWTEAGGRNVMVVRSTNASASGSPSQGTTYSAGNTFGDWTVVSGSADGGTVDATGLQPNTTYYFKFYSENYSYYSPGVGGVSRTTGKPKSRNYNSSTDPYQPATLYLGDTGTFGCWSYGNIASASSASAWYVRIKKADGDLSSGASEGSTGGSGSSENKTATSPRFTSTGTWYWGMRVDYGSYGNWYYLADQDAETDMDADGATATLTVTVNALDNPTPGTAVTNTANPGSAINLTWSKSAKGCDVLIVRNTADSWTAPNPGTSYSAGNTIGSGTVVYKGSGTSTTDSGLSSETTYYYKFYSENFSYYSSGAATLSGTTASHTPLSVYLRSETGSSYWWNDAGGNANPWWYSAGAFSSNRPDVTGPNIVIFDTTNTGATIVNGAWFEVNQLLFWGSSADRTFTTAAGGGLNFRQSGAKIENTDTKTMTFNVPVILDAATQINPVNGNMAFSQAITNNGGISVYGGNSKMLTLSGVVSGAGGLSIEEYSTVKIAGASTYSGDTEINAGELWMASGGSLATPAIYVGDVAAATDAKLWIETAGITVDDDITVRGAGDWSRYIGGLNTSGNVTYSGDITVNNHVFFDANSSGGTSVFSGTISGAADKHIVINGPGTVSITAANSYPGDTRIDQGLLSIPLSGSLGSGGSIDLGSASYPAQSAKLQLSEAAGGSVLTNNITVKNSDNAYDRRTIESLNTSGTAVFLGTIAHDNAGDNLRLYVPSGGTLAFSNAVSGAGQLLVDAIGTVRLAGNSTFTGGTYMDRGTVYLAHNNAAGAGTVYLGKETDAGYSPILRITAGCTIPNNITSRPTDGDVVTIETDTGSGDVTLSGTLSLTKDIEENTDTRVTYISNNLTSGSVVIDELSLNNGGASQNDNRFLFLDGAVTIKDVIDPPTNTHRGLVMRLSPEQTGILTLNGTMNANFYLDSGDVIWGPSFALGSSATEFQVGTTDNEGEAGEDCSVSFTEAGDYTVDFTVGFRTNSAGLTGTRLMEFKHASGTVTVDGKVTLHSTDGAGKYLYLSNAEPVEITGAISGPAGIRKQGTGYLTFSGNATYQGNTYVDNGTLKLGNFSGDVGTIYLNGDANNTTLYIQPGATSEVPVRSLAGAGTRTIGADEAGVSSTFKATIMVSNTTTTFTAPATQSVIFETPGIITGTGGVSKAGAGTVAFRGANDYSALTEVNAGILSIEHANALGGTGNGVVVADGAALEIKGGITTAAEPLTLNGAGAIASPGGALRNTGGANNYIGAVTLASASSIGVDSGTTLTNSGVISGGFALNKVGTGMLVLSNNNTFSGGMLVEKGTVRLQGHTNAMGYGAVNVGTNATLDLNYGTAVLCPVALTLYNGNVTKSTISATTWRGSMTSYSSSTCEVSAGNFYVYGGMSLAGGTLVFSNASQSGMSGGTMTGGGHVTKQGTGIFNLRPGTHSGNITLNEGTIYQYTGAMTASGTLTMENGTTYRSDTAARTMTKSSQINGNVTLGHSGGGDLTFSGAMSLNSGTRTLTIPNTNTISGVISAGGLVKTGAGMLTLSGENTYANGTTISAGTLQIGAGGTSGSVVGDIADNESLLWNRSDDLTYAGIISGTGWMTKLGAGTLTLSGANSYAGGTLVSAGTLKGTTTSLQGFITNNAAVIFDQAGDGTYSSVLSGTGTLDKQGAGTVTLSGANTYTGATTISVGALNIQHNTGLGTVAGGVTVASGAALQLQGGRTIGAEALSLSGTGVSSDGALRSISGNNSFAGAITLALASSIAVDGSGDTLALSGVINGTSTRHLTKIGPGDLELSGANTFAGQLFIQNGSVSVASVSATRDAAQPLGSATATRDVLFGTNATIGTLRYTGPTAESAKFYGIAGGATGGFDVVQNDTILTISGNVTDGSTSSMLTKSGAGTAVFASSANDYSGMTLVEAGTLRAVNANSLGSGGGYDNRATRVASGASLELQGGFTIAERMYLNGTGVGSAGALRSVSGAHTNSQDIYMEANASIGVDADSLTLSDTIQGAFDLTKVGAGTLMLTPINTTFTGKSIVNAGTLAFITAETRLGATPGDYAADQITLNGGTLLLADGNASLSANRGVTLGASGGALAADAARILTINSIITGAGALTKSGDGVVVVSAENTYAGATTISAGKLRLGASDRIPDGSAVSVASGATFNLTNYTETVGSIAGAGSVTLYSGSLTAGVDNTSTEYGGVMSGTGSFTKEGSGTLTLSGDNSYSGDTTISAGTIALGNHNRIADSSDLIVAGGASFNQSGFDEEINSISGVAGSSIDLGSGDLRISGVWTTEFAGVISGVGGKLIHKGDGILTLSGENTYSGGTVVSGGQVRVSSDANLGSPPDPAAVNIWIGSWKSLDFTDDVTVDAGRTLYISDADGGHLTVEASNTVDYLGAITGGGQFNKSGPGRLNLYAASTYTNQTHIQDGILAIGEDIHLGTPPGSFIAGHLIFTNIEYNTLLMTNTSPAGVSLHGNRGIRLETHALMEVVSNGHLTCDAPISGRETAALSKEGAGKLTLAERSTFGGVLCVNGGELELLATDPLSSLWVNIGEDLTNRASPAAQLSLGTGVILTNNISIRTNLWAETGVRTIAMYPSGSAEITGQIHLYDSVQLGVLADCTLNMSGHMYSMVGESVRVKKVWSGTVMFNHTTNYFKYLDVEGGTARSGVDNAFYEWTDLSISNSATYDMNDFNLHVPVLEGAGTLDLGTATMTLFNGYGRVFSGNITGTGTLDKSGDNDDMGSSDGIQYLTGASDYSGGTVIEHGTVHINNQTNLGTGGITFNNGARLWIAQDSTFDASRTVTLTGTGRVDVYTDRTATFNGPVTGTGGLAIHDNGRVTLTANNDFSGAVTINAGMLRITHNNGLGTVAGATTVASNGAALELLGGITVPGGESLTLNGSGYSSNGAVRNVSGNNTYAGTISLYTASSIGVDGAAETLTLSGVISDVGDRNFTKAGVGTMELTANNTFSGPLYINTGSVEINTVAAAGTAQPLGQHSGSVPHVYIGSAGQNGRLTYTGADGNTSKNFEIPANSTGIVEVTDSEATLSLKSSSANSLWSGSGVFRKQGPGTLYFKQSAANTMSGRVFVDEGTLMLEQTSALGTTPRVVVADGAALELTGASSLYELGTNLLLSGSGGGTGALRALADSTVTSTVQLVDAVVIGASVSANTDLVLSNLIYGAGSLTKTGPGRLVLTNDAMNTFTGTTTIVQGAIDIVRDSSLGTPPTTLTPGHLTLNGGELYKQVSGGGGDYSTLNTNRGLTIGASNGTIRVNANYTWTYDGLVYGSGNLFKDGAGTLRLGGNSSTPYTGAIAVSGGTLIVSGAFASSAVLVTNATLMGAGSVGALTVNGGGCVQPGNSTTDTASVNCTGLTLKHGSKITVPVSATTNGMIFVTGNMTLPSANEQITVDLSYLGSSSNYFRNIPFIYFTGETHSPSHTNWNITGVPAGLKPFMKVRYTPGSGTYYVEGATPYCDITNGMQNAGDAEEISIQVDTVEGLDYDLIYFDAVTYPSGSGASSVTWQKLYSVTATGSSTTFTNNLNSPSLGVGYLRFLRVSPLGAWQNETGSKFASKQVYVAKKAVLYPGRNWVSLPGTPINPTVSNVFGYGLPSGVDQSSSTWVDLYSKGASISPTGTFWLGEVLGLWQWSEGGSGYADLFKLPIDQGFLVNVPAGSPQYLALVGALRTNQQEIVIAGGGALTFVGVLLPGAMHPKELGLVESGFTGINQMRPTLSDKIYIWDRENQCLKTAYLWYNTQYGKWYWNDLTKTALKDSDRPISQDDALIIYTRGTGYIWTNSTYYIPPTSDMNP